MMESVMHFFEEASKRVKKLLDSLDEVMNLKKKDTTKPERKHSEESQTCSDREVSSEGHADHAHVTVSNTGGRFTFDSQGILKGYEPTDREPSQEAVRDAHRAVADAKRGIREAYRAHADAERNLAVIWREYIKERQKNDASE
jgi:hypothetical protein